MTRVSQKERGGRSILSLDLSCIVRVDPFSGKFRRSYNLLKTAVAVVLLLQNLLCVMTPLPVLQFLLLAVADSNAIQILRVTLADALHS